MKILHTSDWHLGKSLEQFSRIKEQEQFLQELKEIVIDEKIDLILVAGDIYDTSNPPAEAEKLFYKYIEEINNNGEVPIVLISGNHDSSKGVIVSNPILNKSGVFIIGKYSDIVPMTKGKNFEVIQAFEGGFKLKVKDEVVTLINMPFPSEQSLNEMLKFETEKDYQKEYSHKVTRLIEKSAENLSCDTINILMSHIFAQGGKIDDGEREIQIGGGYTVQIEDITPDFDYIALGHMHQPQKLNKSSCEHCYYSGAPIQYTKSGANRAKSVNIVTIDDKKNIEVTQKLLRDYKPIRIIRADSFEDAKEQLELLIDLDCYVYFELNIGNLPQSEINELKQMKADIVNIEFRKNIYNDDVFDEDFQSMSIEEAFKEFYKSRKNKDIGDETLKIFSELVVNDN